MNNKEFTAELSRRTGRTAKDTTKLINAFVTELSEQLGDANLINIQGFGTFEVRKRVEHVVVNPSTHQRMLIPPKMELKFKASTTLKDKLK